MLATCRHRHSNSNASAIYHYEASSTGEEYVLRQSIGIDEKLRSTAIDGRAMVASEHRVGRSNVIHIFVQQNDIWDKITTVDEPTFEESFGSMVALSGNIT